MEMLMDGTTIKAKCIELVFEDEGERNFCEISWSGVRVSWSVMWCV
jgi:hypothetical protein